VREAALVGFSAFAAAVYSPTAGTRYVRVGPPPVVF
jgi:hypothetical protein